MATNDIKSQLAESRDRKGHRGGRKHGRKGR